MRIAVGSQNPVKINAVRNVFEKIFPGVEVIAVDVPSTMAQPMSDEETVEGAINRAKQALNNGNVDFGVGLEGGVHKMKNGYFLTNWCAVVNKDGRVGIGGGAYMQLPERAVKKLLEGKELGTAMDELTGMHNTKQRMGSVGILTKDLSSRQTEFEGVVALALAKFISPEFYD